LGILAGAIFTPVVFAAMFLAGCGFAVVNHYRRNRKRKEC
jgi:hypothetical protein